MRMSMFILLIVIGVMYVISKLIFKYKLKIPKPQYIDVSTLQPKYLKHILIGLLIFTFLISIFIGNFKCPSLWLLIKIVIDSIYRIKYLKNDKSRYYIIIELVFGVYGCIVVATSFFW